MHSRDIARGIKSDTTAKSRFGIFAKLAVSLLAILLVAGYVFNHTATTVGNAQGIDQTSDVIVTSTTTLVSSETKEFDPSSPDYEAQLEAAGYKDIDPTDYGMPADAKLTRDHTATSTGHIMYDYGTNAPRLIVDMTTTTDFKSWSGGFMWLTFYKSNSTTINDVKITIVYENSATTPVGAAVAIDFAQWAGESHNDRYNVLRRNHDQINTAVDGGKYTFTNSDYTSGSLGTYKEGNNDVPYKSANGALYVEGKGHNHNGDMIITATIDGYAPENDTVNVFHVDA